MIKKIFWENNTFLILLWPGILSLVSGVILDKSLHLSKLQFPHLEKKWETLFLCLLLHLLMMTPTSPGCSVDYYYYYYYIELIISN